MSSSHGAPLARLGALPPVGGAARTKTAAADAAEPADGSAAFGALMSALAAASLAAVGQDDEAAVLGAAGSAESDAQSALPSPSQDPPSACATPSDMQTVSPPSPPAVPIDAAMLLAQGTWSGAVRAQTTNHDVPDDGSSVVHATAALAQPVALNSAPAARPPLPAATAALDAGVDRADVRDGAPATDSAAAPLSMAQQRDSAAPGRTAFSGPPPAPPLPPAVRAAWAQNQNMDPQVVEPRSTATRPDVLAGAMAEPGFSGIVPTLPAAADRPAGADGDAALRFRFTVANADVDNGGFANDLKPGASASQNPLTALSEKGGALPFPERTMSMIEGARARAPMTRASAAPSSGVAQEKAGVERVTIFSTQNGFPASISNGLPLLFSEQMTLAAEAERKPARSAGAFATPGIAELPAGAGAPAAVATPSNMAETLAPSAAGLNTASFTERLVDQVSWWLSQNAQRADFQIEMPDGPPVSVHVQVQGNEAQVVFRSDQAEIRLLLGDALPQLEKAFGNEGLLLAGVSVGVGADASASSSGQSTARETRVANDDDARRGAARVAQPQPVAAAASGLRRADGSASRGALDLWV